uniref:hypothetical protein n=1 Tax=Azoarcus taiwanensis TaxID=666964 RepID=UPI001B7CEA79
VVNQAIKCVELVLATLVQIRCSSPFKGEGLRDLTPATRSGSVTVVTAAATLPEGMPLLASGAAAIPAV